MVGRDAPIGTMRWFQVEPCYVFHVFNARTEGARVLCDVMRMDRPSMFPDATGRMPPGDTGLARPWRWTLDLAGDTDRAKEEPLSDLAGEFPRCDERFTGQPYRHGFCALANPERRGRTGSAFYGVAHLDLATGASAAFEMPDGDSVNEPVFVPRDPSAEEGDGYLLVVQYVARENRSDLLVLDAREVERGPLARAALSHRVPAGFHGSWLAN